MARLIKCPRCQSPIDVTSVTGGATVRCADCGAMVRVPTGSTGVRPAVSAPAAAPPPAPEPARGKSSGRSTALFKKMANTRQPGGSRPPSRSSVEAVGRGGGGVPRRSGSNPTMMGLIIAGVLFVLVIVMIFANQSKQASIKAKEEAVRQKNEETKKKNAEILAEARRQALEDEAAEKAEKEAAKVDKKKGGLQKDASGGYKAPTTFEPGAGKFAKGSITAHADPTLLREFESLASGGKIADIVREPGKWFPAMLFSFLSENESVARGAFQAMHDICQAKNITTESGKNPVRIDLFNSAAWRGGEYTHWSEWWEKPQNKIAMGLNDPKLLEEIRTKPGSVDASKANWDKLMQDLRAGGAFDQMDRPEGKAFAQVKSMGPAAYPHLAKFIDNEDPLLGKAAVKVLNMLTGRDGQMPTEANKGQVKAEWEAWIAKQGQ
jgi:hypothetical protein